MAHTGVVNTEFEQYIKNITPNTDSSSQNETRNIQK